MKKLVGFLLMITIASSSTFAAEPPAQPPSSGNKNLWVATMQNNLPKTLCQPQQYFVKCFDVTEAQCLETTALYVKGCLDSLSLALPSELSKEQGEHWGKMVGRCSFDLYEKFMSAKKRKLPECELKTPSENK